MNKYSYFADEIKQRVTAREAAERYGVDINSRGKALCVWHNDRHPSLSFKGGMCKCFACGKGGSCIDVTMTLFGLPFIGAIEKLNNDFNCGLILDRKMTLREQRDADKRRRDLEAEQAKRQAERKAYEDKYNALWDEWCRLDLNRINHAPKSPDEPLHPLWIEAVDRVEYIQYRIDTEL
jgi:hypothetical protein